ncbi:MAG: hypothetical protein K6T61_13000 [Bryobacteraceae bacterium]|nr:hypothetical protein [Bryobacteraceae bacterium]
MDILRPYLLPALCIAAITAAGYWVFPGHTYLQSDTQIYVPMLEHLWNPAVFQNDFMVRRPHLAFTIFDEMAIALRRLTGLGFREVLEAQQLLFRFLGLLGVFLLARSLRMAARMALLVTAVFSLGAFIGGPTVLTVEYEPIPRAYALPLLFLAMGLIAHGRDLSAGVAASLAFLYHPTTTLAFWAVYFCLAVWPAGGFAAMRRRVLGLGPLLVAVLLLWIASRLQPGVTESPDFLGRIAPWWEQMLRLRSTYLWVSLWYPHWYWHYAILLAVAAAAFARLRRQMPTDLQFFLAGLPLLGVLSVPLSWLLLEHWKLAVAPQLQVARNLLFITAGAVLMSMMAGIKAAQTSRWWESLLWFLAALAVPVGEPVQWTLLLRLEDPVVRRRLLVAACLALAAAVIAWAEPRGLRWQRPAWALLAAAPFVLYPVVGKVVPFPRLQTQQIAELAGWAKSATPVESVFLFADAGRGLEPGIFRATGLRAVYVDWKGGGQGNYLPSVAREWWKRWQAADALKFKGGDIGSFAALGVDYVALRHGTPARGGTLVFENQTYKVYRLR